MRGKKVKALGALMAYLILVSLIHWLVVRIAPMSSLGIVALSVACTFGFLTVFGNLLKR